MTTTGRAEAVTMSVDQRSPAEPVAPSPGIYWHHPQAAHLSSLHHHHELGISGEEVPY